MKSLIILATWHSYYKEMLDRFDLDPSVSRLIYNLSIVILTALTAYLAYKFGKWVIYKLADIFSKKKQSPTLRVLNGNKFFSYLSYYFPLLIIKYNISIALPTDNNLHEIVEKVYMITAIILFVLIINSVLNTFVQLNQYKVQNKSKPIKGLVQFAQIIIYFITTIICISVIFSKSPSTVIAGLGAASAILMLIFKDSITGLVAGVQISFNRMVEIGDWISLTKYDVDGEVVDITLTSIKVRNWDNTMSTVPSYNLVVNDSVKNWQNMLKSGGRLMKRSINIDMLSVRFCTEEMLARYSQIAGVEIPNGNIPIEWAEKDGNENSNLLTKDTSNNLAIFRKYLHSYLTNHPQIHKTMLLLVRENQSTQFGIPVEIFCYTKTTVTAEYEEVQSNIIEHVLAMVPYFDLKVYQATMAAR